MEWKCCICFAFNYNLWRIFHRSNSGATAYFSRRPSREKYLGTNLKLYACNSSQIPVLRFLAGVSSPDCQHKLSLPTLPMILAISSTHPTSWHLLVVPDWPHCELIETFFLGPSLVELSHLPFHSNYELYYQLKSHSIISVPHLVYIKSGFCSTINVCVFKSAQFAPKSPMNRVINLKLTQSQAGPQIGSFLILALTHGR